MQSWFYTTLKTLFGKNRHKKHFSSSPPRVTWNPDWRAKHPGGEVNLCLTGNLVPSWWQTPRAQPHSLSNLHDEVGKDGLSLAFKHCHLCGFFAIELFLAGLPRFLRWGKFCQSRKLSELQLVSGPASQRGRVHMLSLLFTSCSTSQSLPWTWISRR
jgi:hypothetical protein